MPSLDDQIDDTNSSIVSDIDDAVAGGDFPAGDTAAAASSPAEGEQDADLLSVVRDVVKESRGQTDPASPAEGEQGSEAAASADDDEFADVPFNRHPRFKQVVKERREFKEKLTAMEREVEPLRQDAERYQNVVGFLDDAGLSSEEAADMLTIGGLMKTDPVEAWKRMKPTIQNLLIAAGEVLPDDLQQRVSTGELSKEAAIEIARAKASVASVQRQQSFREQREQRTSQQNSVRSMQQAASDWETDRVRKDPNFAAKLPDIQREVVYLQRTEGVPTTAEGVKDQLAKAYKTVNDRFKPAQPAPQPKQAVRPVMGGQVAGNQQPAEMSTLDIIRANRRAS
ncbi:MULTISPECIES: hypothetical protein [unclassified Shinella]|uniref:hypothetical protein n=1 Tax=unclassified Shinella TaxID=2643062 RepID=UPI00225D455B|nr:conserved hypothetical protein [Rhizobiaceae bacterium]CAK7259103.1 conserved protein of unknown function [Shinella sp. WSC3-e]